MRMADPGQRPRTPPVPPRALQRRRAGNTAIVLLGLASVGVLGAELFIRRELHFSFEGWLGFYAWFGFAVGLALVLPARWLGRLLGRAEDHYD